MLFSRYRYAMVDLVNKERKAEGRAPLDPSPVLLAHPRLDLYVDVDSKHSFDAVGCTSCHDGSGQETDFVVTAHTAAQHLGRSNHRRARSRKSAQPDRRRKRTDSIFRSMLHASAQTRCSTSDVIHQLAPTTQQTEHLKKLEHAGEEEKTGPDPLHRSSHRQARQGRHPIPALGREIRTPRAARLSPGV